VTVGLGQHLRSGGWLRQRSTDPLSLGLESRQQTGHFAKIGARALGGEDPMSKPMLLPALTGPTGLAVLTMMTFGVFLTFHSSNPPSLL